MGGIIESIKLIIIEIFKLKKRHLVLKMGNPGGLGVKPRPPLGHIFLTPPTASGVGIKSLPQPQAQALSPTHRLGHVH